MHPGEHVDTIVLLAFAGPQVPTFRAPGEKRNKQPGEQSAGKSSLLENISGIQFPRAQNTCTRMPCVLTMLTDPTIQESRAGLGGRVASSPPQRKSAFFS